MAGFLLLGRLAHWNDAALARVSFATELKAHAKSDLVVEAVTEEPEEGILGDLMLCWAVADRQAGEARARGQQDHTTGDEVDLLTVHGILHLLGYDHAEPEEHREMFGLQARLLEEWGASGASGR